MENIIDNEIASTKAYSEFQTEEGLKVLKKRLISNIVATVTGIGLIVTLVLISCFAIAKGQTYFEQYYLPYTIAFVVELGGLIAAGIIGLMCQRKMANYNEHFKIAWSATKKQIGAGVANGVFQSVVRSEVAKNIAGSATNIYQAYQGFNKVKHVFQGFEEELMVIGNYDKNNIGKAFKKYMMYSGISALILIAGASLVVYGFVQEVAVYNVINIGVVIAAIGLLLFGLSIGYQVNFEYKAYKTFDANKLN